MTSPKVETQEEERAFVIDNIVIPYTDWNDRWIAPDLEQTWQYYPNYLKHCINSKIVALSPSAYINKALAWILPHAIRDKALHDYVQWDDRYMADLEDWHNTWKQYFQPVVYTGDLKPTLGRQEER